MTSISSPAKAIIFLSGITALNVLTAAGFSLAGAVHASRLASVQAAGGLTAAFALYAAARAVPLALFALYAIAKGKILAIRLLGALAGLIQLLDAWVGWTQHDLGKTVGPLVLAVLQFIALGVLAKTLRTMRAEQV